MSDGLRVAGLFAGVGGLEKGLAKAGHETELLCEIDASARAVLSARFPGVALHDDIATLKDLPEVDLVTAGFPCQNLSQAGRTEGIKGSKSGLVEHVFRLLEGRPRLRWLLLENVPFMLQLDRGRAMSYLTERLSAMGFRWAYRVIDSRAFGLPQRRRRVLLLASKSEDPREVLFHDEEECPTRPDHKGLACGFYWTEGLRGLGWAVDSVPTLKGGSALGIPSPPAIWFPDGHVGTPDIRDAERLQGFPSDWTAPAMSGRKRGMGSRWKLVGNAVTVEVAAWIGERLNKVQAVDLKDKTVGPVKGGRSWPKAAWGEAGKAYHIEFSEWPKLSQRPPLTEFLNHPTKALSLRASAGFLKRMERSSLRFVDGFKDAIRKHRDLMSEAQKIAAKA